MGSVFKQCDLSTPGSPISRETFLPVIAWYAFEENLTINHAHHHLFLLRLENKTEGYGMLFKTINNKHKTKASVRAGDFTEEFVTIQTKESRACKHGPIIKLWNIAPVCLFLWTAA